MFRIDSEGSTVDNKFTEGDPSLGVPATVVSADWLNSVQEEIAKLVEYAGITLDKGNDNQLQAAILELFKRGGRQTPLSQALDNNAGPLDVVGFTFDSATVKCVKAIFRIERKTDTQNVQETGTLFVTWDSADNVWRVSAPSNLDDAGVVFSTVIDSGSVSKLQYTTDDLTGTTYTGVVDFTEIVEIR